MTILRSSHGSLKRAVDGEYMSRYEQVYSGGRAMIDAPTRQGNGSAGEQAALFYQTMRSS
jgi:hypothetical protein